jgi:hypothetical protein
MPERGLLSIGPIGPICAGPVVTSPAPADSFRVGSTPLVLFIIVPVGLGSVALVSGVRVTFRCGRINFKAEGF